MDVFESYKQDGFSVAEDCLPRDLVSDVLRDSRRVFQVQMERHGIDTPPLDSTDFDVAIRRLFNEHYDAFLGAASQVQYTMSLWRLIAEDAIHQRLKVLGMEFPAVCTRPNVQFNSPYLAKAEGHWKFPIHQDWRSMQGSLNSMVVWIPLVDADTELGALQVVPGSHLDGLRETVPDEWYATLVEEIDEEEFVPVEIRVGSVLFFSSFLIHRSGINSSDRVRWSCQLRYNDAADPHFAARNYPCPYKTAPQQELMDCSPTSEVREWFGAGVG